MLVILGRVQFDRKELRNIDFNDKFINDEDINDNFHGQRLHLLNLRRHVAKRLNSRLNYCDTLSNTAGRFFFGPFNGAILSLRTAPHKFIRMINRPLRIPYPVVLKGSINLS